MSAAAMRVVSSVVVLLYFVVWLHFLMRKGSKGYRHKMDAFLERERRANAARKKTINPEYFITPDTTELPIADYPDDSKYNIVKKRQEAALKKSGLTMLKLPEPQSNTDLKFEFGLANLNQIIAYEENYQDYIRALNNWADALIRLDLPREAELVLEEAIRLGSELSKSYTLLGEIYAKNQDQQKLTGLCDKLSQPDILLGNPHMKDKVLTYLKDLSQGGTSL